MGPNFLIVIKMYSRGKASRFGIKSTSAKFLITKNNVKKMFPEEFGGQLSLVHRDDDIVLA